MTWGGLNLRADRVGRFLRMAAVGSIVRRKPPGVNEEARHAREGPLDASLGAGAKDLVLPLLGEEERTRTLRGRASGQPWLVICGLLGSLQSTGATADRVAGGSPARTRTKARFPVPTRIETLTVMASLP